MSAVKQLFKNLGLGVLVIMIAAIGVYLGMTFREMRASQDRQLLQSAGPSSKLLVGTGFPDIEILNGDSILVHTVDLIRDNGSIFLFLEPGCPPCESMTRKWQALIDSGEFPREQLIGIGFDLPEHLQSYARHSALTFPIYSDTASTFMRDYGVADFPLVVIVGKSGLVKAYTYDHRVSFDPKQLALQLAS